MLVLERDSSHIETYLRRNTKRVRLVWRTYFQDLQPDQLGRGFRILAYTSGNLGITVFKIFIWEDILSDIWSEPLNVISQCISNSIPHQVKMVDRVIHILMHVFSFLFIWSVASRIMQHVIHSNGT